MKVKIYSPKRSGSNLLQYLLEQTGKVDVLVNEGGWKHGPPALVGDRQLIILKTYDDWKRSDERYRHPGNEPRQGPETYFERVAEYLRFAQQNATAMIVYYDQLISDPYEWFQICEHLAIEAEMPEIPTKAMNRNGKPTNIPYGQDVPWIHRGKI